jgi:hypothetical protein
MQRKNMKKMLALMVCLGLLGIAGSGAAYATVITFEELYTGREAVAIPIPDGYMGFSWDALCLTKYVFRGILGAGTGYENGTIGNVSMYNPGAEPVSFSVAIGSFDFRSAYITSAWSASANVTVEGWLGGAKIYSSDITTYNDRAYAFDFGWSNIDTVKFLSGNIIVVDNITTVPLPGAIVLLGSGLLPLLGWRRFRKS